MKKIAIYTPNLLFSVGGAHAFALRLGNEICKLYPDYNLDFVTDFNEKIFNEEEHKKRFNEKYNLNLTTNANIKVICTKKKSSLFSKLIFQRKLHKISKNYDLFINAFHNVHFFYGKINVHLVHFPSKQRVLGSPTLKKYPFLYPIMKKYDKKYSSTYHLYICNSKFTQNWLHKYWNIPQEKSSVLYPAIEPIAKKYHFDFDKKENTILILSRISPEKEILPLVEKFIENQTLLTNYKLIIAGNCPNYSKSSINYLEKIKKITKNNNNIELKINLSWDEISTLIGKSKFFWHGMGFSVNENEDPLHLEHFGMTTVEAMTAGVIPIVINKGGQKEIVDNGENGYTWNTLDELIEKTVSLIDDNVKAKEMSEKAKLKSEQYCINSFSENLKNIINDYNLL